MTPLGISMLNTLLASLLFLWFDRIFFPLVPNLKPNSNLDLGVAVGLSSGIKHQKKYKSKVVICPLSSCLLVAFPFDSLDQKKCKTMTCGSKAAKAKQRQKKSGDDNFYHFPVMTLGLFCIFSVSFFMDLTRESSLSLPLFLRLSLSCSLQHTQVVQCVLCIVYFVLVVRSLFSVISSFLLVFPWVFHVEKA